MESSAVPDNAPRITRGQRIAGVVLIANATFLIADALLFGLDLSAAGLVPGQAIPSIVLDLLIGTSLMFGSRKLLVWAIVRVTLGLVFFSAKAVMLQDYFAVVVPVIVCGPLLALLLGDAGRLRTRAAVATFGLYAGLEVIVIAFAVIGVDPVVVMTRYLFDDLQPNPVREVRGIASPYKLTIPNDEWYAYTAAATLEKNADVDLWLVRPYDDAHIMIIAEDVSGYRISMEPYAEAAIEHLRQGSANFRVLEHRTLPGFPETRQLFHITATVDGTDMEYYFEFVTAGNRAFQVLAWALKSTFRERRDELRQILESFEVPPPDPVRSEDMISSAYPPDLEALPKQIACRAVC